MLTVVTVVAGSGKSTLINEVFLAQHPSSIVIDQSAVGVNRRSNPATYTGIMDGIRTLVRARQQREPLADFIKNADWIIDLGPDGGSQGGRVIFEGTPADLLGATGSFTAEFLRKAVI